MRRVLRAAAFSWAGAVQGALSLLFIAASFMDVANGARYVASHSAGETRLVLGSSIAGCWLVALAPWAYVLWRPGPSWRRWLTVVPLPYFAITGVYAVWFSASGGADSLFSWQTWHIAFLWPVLPWADVSCALGMAAYVCH